MTWLLNFFLGCTHDHRAWPRAKPLVLTGEAPDYQRCLDCGEALDYWFGGKPKGEPAAGEQHARFQEAAE